MSTYYTEKPDSVFIPELVKLLKGNGFEVDIDDDICKYVIMIGTSVYCSTEEEGDYLSFVEFCEQECSSVNVQGHECRVDDEGYLYVDDDEIEVTIFRKIYDSLTNEVVLKVTNEQLSSAFEHYKIPGKGTFRISFAESKPTRSKPTENGLETLLLMENTIKEVENEFGYNFEYNSSSKTYNFGCKSFTQESLDKLMEFCNK